jgi:DNA-binding NarL/FixJ family response regulator
LGRPQSSEQKAILDFCPRSAARAKRKDLDTAGSQSLNGPVRVVIVDDQQAFREAAHRLLAARGYDVVGEADCADCALAAVECHEPDAVLIDVRLGDDDGFAVCSALTRRRPGLAILVVSDSDSDDRREQAARCGARGYVPKSRLHEADLGQFWPPS